MSDTFDLDSPGDRDRVFGSHDLSGSANGQVGDKEFEQRHRWLAASIAVTQQLLAGQDDGRLDAIPRAAQQAASADLATLALVIEPGRLQVKAARGVLTEHVLGLILDMESSMAGQVARSKEPRLPTDHRDARGVDQPVPIGSVVMVPLLVGDEALGALSVGRLIGRRPFTGADVDHIAGFAGHAGVAMELDRARSDRQQRRILDDRDRVGVDLNRDVIQKLVAVGIGLQSLVAVTPRHASRKRIIGYVADIDATIKRMRATIFDTAPAQDTADLADRILAAVDDQTVALGCEVVTTFTGQLDRAIPDTLADSAATVVREALGGIAMCAHATRVELRVGVSRDLITVVILDNGTNAVTAARIEAAAVLRRHAETRAGTLATFTPPDGGTQLVWTATIPSIR